MQQPIASTEYTGAPFCAQVTALAMLQSANVRGPGDNAHAESFFHSLKAELTRGVVVLSERVLRRQLQRYMLYYNTIRQLQRYMLYYNTIRLHSSLAYVSPLAFEQQLA